MQHQLTVDQHRAFMLAVAPASDHRRPKSQHETLAGALANMREVSPDPQLHDLVPFTAGGRVFAVFADEVESTAEAKLPALLPNAPPAVLGVVCVRGRMLTVLDPVALLTGEATSWPETLPGVIALSGDEQLAVAAHERLDTITIAATDIQPTTLSDNEDSAGGVALGIARYGGEEITVLSVAHLFAAAMRRKERRRRRF